MYRYELDHNLPSMSPVQGLVGVYRRERDLNLGLQKFGSIPAFNLGESSFTKTTILQRETSRTTENSQYESGGGLGEAVGTDEKKPCLKSPNSCQAYGTVEDALSTSLLPSVVEDLLLRRVPSTLGRSLCREEKEFSLENLFSPVRVRKQLQMLL